MPILKESPGFWDKIKKEYPDFIDVYSQELLCKKLSQLRKETVTIWHLWVRIPEDGGRFSEIKEIVHNLSTTLCAEINIIEGLLLRLPPF